MRKYDNVFYPRIMGYRSAVRLPEATVNMDTAQPPL